MANLDEAAALAERLEASLSKAGQVTATLAQFAEMLVPAMISFQSALKDKPGDQEPETNHVVDLMALLGQRLDVMDDRLFELVASIGEISHGGSPADGLLEPMAGDPAAAARFAARLDRLEAALQEKLDAIETRRLAEQPVGFIVRLEERLRRIEAALAMVVGAAAEIAPTKAATLALEPRLAGLEPRLTAIEPRLAAIEGRLVPPDQVARLNIAVGSMETMSADLTKATAAITAQTPALSAVTDDLAAAALVLAERTTPLTPLAHTLDAAIAGFSKIDPATLAQAVGVATAQEIAGQVGSWSQSLEQRIDAVATAVDEAAAATHAAREDVRGGVGVLRAALEAVATQLEQIAEEAVRSRPDLTPVLARFDGAAAQAERARVEAATGFEGLRASVGDVSSKIIAVSEQAERLRPDLSPIIARIEVAAAVGSEARAESAAAFDGVKNAISQVVARMEGVGVLVTRLAPNLAPVLERIGALQSAAEARNADVTQITARLDDLVVALSAFAPVTPKSFDEAALAGRLGDLVDQKMAALAREVEALSKRPDRSVFDETGLVAKLGDLVDQRFAVLADRLEQAMGVPGERIATAVRSLQDLGERMRALDDRAAELMAKPGEALSAADLPHVKLAEAVASINDLGQRFAGALKRLEKRLSGAQGGKADEDPGHAEVVAIAAQMRENTAEFLAIGAALSQDINRLADDDASPAKPAAKSRRAAQSVTTP